MDGRAPRIQTDRARDPRTRHTPARPDRHPRCRTRSDLKFRAMQGSWLPRANRRQEYPWAVTESLSMPSAAYDASPEISGIIRCGRRSARGNGRMRWPHAPGPRPSQASGSGSLRPAPRSDGGRISAPQRPEARCSRAMRPLVPACPPSACMRRHGTPRNGDPVHAETDPNLANGEEQDETALNRISGADRNGGTAFRAQEVQGRTSSRLARYRAVSLGTDKSAKAEVSPDPWFHVVHRSVVQSLPRCGADTGISSCLSN